jgi:hypothetical protein
MILINYTYQFLIYFILIYFNLRWNSKFNDVFIFKLILVNFYLILFPYLII